MSYEVTESGVFVESHRVYVAIRGGVLKAMVRATDKATFDAQAVSVGLKVTDEETGALKPAPGVTITEMGPYVLNPATYDADGNVTTPAEVGDRYHVNFWLSPDLVEVGKWEGWALAWSFYGQDGVPNKNEQSLVYDGIELIDPMTVPTPHNVLL